MTVSARPDPLERVQAYRLAVEAMRDARVDAGKVRRDVVMRDIAGQLMRSAGSIAANIAEGYSRGTGADRRKFFEYALGSTRETLVWYDTFAADAFPAERVSRLISIRRLLLTMIRNSRTDAGSDRARFEK